MVRQDREGDPRRAFDLSRHANAVSTMISFEDIDYVTFVNVVVIALFAAGRE